MKKNHFYLIILFIALLSGCSSVSPTRKLTGIPKTSKVYDEKGNLVETGEYDERGNLIKTIYEAGDGLYQTGGSESYSYDDQGRMIEWTTYDHDNKIRTQEFYTYNEKGDLLERVQKSYSGLLITAERYDYHYEAGRIKERTITYFTGEKEKDKEEQVYSYDTGGQLFRIDIRHFDSDLEEWADSYQEYEYTYKDKQLISMAYALVDVAKNKTENLRRTVYTQYDEEGRIVIDRVTATGAMSHETVYTYNEFGLVETKTELLGQFRKYTYTYWED